MSVASSVTPVAEVHGHEAHHRPEEPILEVKDLTIAYGQVEAVSAVSFRLAVGDQVAVIGPNGAGKSTLFKAIAGVLPPAAGRVCIGGSAPDEHICIAYLPQRNEIDWRFPVTVSDVVLMGRTRRLGWFRRPGAQDRALVRDCLAVVQLEALADRRIDELSGGQQQRMFIARALAQEAELMLMDEVMTACDTPSKAEIYRILETLKARGVTVMVSTHDLDEAATHYDRVLLLNRQLHGFGTADEVFTAAKLTAAYGGALRLVQTPQGTLVLNDSCCGGGGTP